MTHIAKYIHFSEEQKLRAGAVDLEEFLRLRGERLIKSGRDKRLASNHSVTVRGSRWYDHAERHIDKDVISHFARAGTLYEDAAHHNCVFLGTDENGVPRHAHLRSTNSFGEAFRINVESSDPRYSFHHIGTDGELYVFEAPIDLLSYITLHPDCWQEHSCVACCGTSFLPVQQMKEMMPKPIQRLYLCLDHDEAGQAAAERMTEAAEPWGAEIEWPLPERKDWNDDLVAEAEEQEVLLSCQQLCGM